MKYYAVRQGYKPGIYTTWEDCQNQIKGFPKAEFKKFDNEEDAKNFIINNEKKEQENNVMENLPSVYSFVDGSYNIDTKVYGYGGFISINGEKHILQGSGNDEEMALMRNVSGEILGSMAAISFAIENNLKEITIFYDYKGIECWANGIWKTTKNGTKAYKEFFDKNKDKINIKFQKVKAHIGIDGNEEADRLAKQAVGII